MWASETPCRDFEARLRRLVSDLDAGRRGLHELRDRFAAAELHRHFLLTRGCPCGGRLHSPAKFKAAAKPKSAAKSAAQAAAAASGVKGAVAKVIALQASDEEEPPATLPPSFFSDAAARDALFKADSDALHSALDAWDGGRHAQREFEHKRELPKESKDGGTYKYRVS